MSYWNEATITFSGKTTTVKWLESIIAEKQNETWKITLLHSTETERTSQ